MPDDAKLAPDAVAESMLVAQNVSVRWDDVAGLHNAKEALKEAVIMPVKFPQLFTGKRKPWKGILLYGPPGTGKSYLAKAVATEAQSTFFSVSSADLISKHHGESEKSVRSLFEAARLKKPSVIFIDEIDSLCGKRSENEHEVSRRVKTEFLVQMGGVGVNNDGVLLLAATNLPWTIDSAMRRRLQRRIYIPLPDLHARAHIFKLSVGNTPHKLSSEDFLDLARLCEGYSGSDIGNATNAAIMEPVRRLSQATHFRANCRGKWELCTPQASGAVQKDLSQIDHETLAKIFITKEHFVQSLQVTKSSVGDAELAKFELWTHDYGEDG